MPIYTYECEHCGQRFDAKQSFSDQPLTVCPTCEGKIHRVIQPVGVVFKGSGFYVTDSKAKQNLATPTNKKDESKPAEGGSDAASTGSNGNVTTEKSETSTKTETPAKPVAETTISAEPK